MTTDITQLIRSAVDAAMIPLNRRCQALEAELAEAVKPRSASGAKPSQLFAPPGIRTGESPLSSRGFSLMRLGANLQGVLADDRCKVELDQCQRIRQCFETAGFRATSGKSMIVPLSAAYLEPLDSSLADEFRESMAAGVHGADPDELRHAAVRQGLSVWDDTAGGSLLGSIQQAEMIELLRAREIFSLAGAREVPLPPNGRLQYPRHTGATTAYWVGEGQAITESNQTTGSLMLIAKKLAVLLKSPNELLRFGGPTVEAFFRNDMAASLAKKLDRSMLDGVGSELAVKGLLNYAGINTLVASTTGNDGDTLEPEDLGRLIAEVEEQDVDTDVAAFAFIARPRMLQQILDRRADAIGSGDEQGPFLFSVNRTAIENGKPALIRGKRIVTSTAVANTRSKGSSSNLSYILAGDFAQWLIGRVGVMELAVGTSGTDFEEDQTKLRLITHVDAAPRHEAAFAMIDDLIL